MPKLTLPGVTLSAPAVACVEEVVVEEVVLAWVAPIPWQPIITARADKVARIGKITVYRLGVAFMGKCLTA
jgi:hypothetical protein